MVSMALAVLLLSACGVGGDDDEATETAEAPATTAAESPVDLTSQSSTAAVGTPDIVTVASEDGTPDAGEGSPTPAIVVSAPPVQVPTRAPQPVAATPAPGGATPVSGEAQVAGDGTGGPTLQVAEQAPDAAAGTQVTTTATSCDVAVPPPFTGVQPQQQTVSDVNLRVGPGTDCDPVGEPIGQGVAVEVLSDPVEREGDEFDWVQVAVEGTEGWLAIDFLEPAAE